VRTDSLTISKGDQPFACGGWSGDPVKLEWIGWVATALFASSYFFKQPLALRKVQAGAAMLWVIYGLIIHAFPVVVANVVVASVALYSQRAART
jgi:hypothetical protein